MGIRPSHAVVRIIAIVRRLVLLVYARAFELYRDITALTIAASFQPLHSCCAPAICDVLNNAVYHFSFPCYFFEHSARPCCGRCHGLSDLYFVVPICSFGFWSMLATSPRSSLAALTFLIVLTLVTVDSPQGVQVILRCPSTG